MGHKYLYLYVTDDDLELPLAVADSVKELAAYCGVNMNTIYSTFCHQKTDHRKSRYVRVILEDNNEIMQ